MSTRRHSRFGGKLTGTTGKDGPTSMRSNETNPVVWSANKLRRLIPTAFEENKAHYDTRPLQCIKCTYTPRSRVFLDDTPEGYVCRSAKSCAERAKESYD